MTKRSEKKIAIIGAGISGILACKHAIEKGFTPMVFESKNVIGGVWTRTIDSTKLQTPKKYYQFSDFPWPDSVTGNFPDHTQVVSYIQAYAVHFNVFPLIKFNCKVVEIEYCGPSDEDMRSWELWGGGRSPFSSIGKWNVVVQDISQSLFAPQVYITDFVVLCNGNYSDFPNIPQFPLGKGPDVFDGEVIHSMNYSEMDRNTAADFIRNKRLAIVGFQKSAIDIAAEVAEVNGEKHPCTLLYRAVHWTVPEHLNELNFKNLNRFSEFMIHKPQEGFFLWLLAFIHSPLLWIFSTLVETYLKWIYPLKKYNMIPKHRFLKQVSSCMVSVLPPKFYQRVKEGSLVLQKMTTFFFCENGLILVNDNMEEAEPLKVDSVIFATGYESGAKFASVFKSNYFKKCILESSTPFYRECIHPRIPQLAILGFSESLANLFTSEMRSKWLAHFLAGGIKLPTIREMEEDVLKWEKCMRHYADKNYKRSCISMLLPIYCNDLLLKDMGINPKRKKWFLSELFATYSPIDYADLSLQAKTISTVSNCK